MPLAAAGAAYVAALAAPALVPAWAVALAAAALAGTAVGVYHLRRDKGDLVLAAWPALHLLVHLTGALASPLIALPAAWAVALGRLRPRAALAGVAAAALLVPLAGWVHGGAFSLASLARYELLIGLAAAYARVRGRPAARPAREAAEAPPAEGRTARGASDAEVWRSVLEVARRAAEAHEAALWRADAERQTAELVGVAAAPGAPAPEPAISLVGTPYRWAIEEQLPQRVEPGRRELPVPWAEEMLLVPVDLPGGVLALAYAAPAPLEADEAALEAARHLSALAGLLRLRAGAEHEDARVRAIAEAAQTLPGEIEVDAFARRLAGLVRRGTGAAGAAVALGFDEAGRGSVVHVDDTGPSPQFAAAGFGEGESRLALALKHGVDLTYVDLPRERDRLPLCTPGEQWLEPPRSAAVFPLMAGEKALGAVVAWHPEPGRFGERETELLRLLCTLAPPPLQSARQYQALGERAATDALTGLANRATFQERL
ncbi:MAG TPA: GAF domain-containing protein, partial [Longimicrobiaceae bacterium]|nr:GAF domain-containing protein [Longimicrobiaceae bacterium]